MRMQAGMTVDDQSGKGEKAGGTTERWQMKTKASGSRSQSKNKLSNLVMWCWVITESLSELSSCPN